MMMMMMRVLARHRVTARSFCEYDEVGERGKSAVPVRIKYRTI